MPSKLKNCALFCNSLIHKYNFLLGFFLYLTTFSIPIKHTATSTECESHGVY